MVVVLGSLPRMHLRVRLEAVGGGERFTAGRLLARVRTLASVRPDVRLQVVGGREGFAASITGTLVLWGEKSMYN